MLAHGGAQLAASDQCGCPCMLCTSQSPGAWKEFMRNFCLHIVIPPFNFYFVRDFSSVHNMLVVQCYIYMFYK